MTWEESCFCWGTDETPDKPELRKLLTEPSVIDQGQLLEEAAQGLETAIAQRDEFLKQRNELVLELYEVKKDREKVMVQFLDLATENHELKQSLAVNGLSGAQAMQEAVAEYYNRDNVELAKQDAARFEELPPFHLPDEECLCPDGCVHWP